MNHLLQQLEENRIKTVTLQGLQCSDEDAVVLGELLSRNDSASLLASLLGKLIFSSRPDVCVPWTVLQQEHSRDLDQWRSSGCRKCDCSCGSVTQNNTRICSFTLARAKFGVQAALELGRGLSQNRGLHQLSLCSNGLTNTCMRLICEGIARHPRLTHLSVDIEPIDVSMLCDMLSVNRSITHLQLYNISLGDVEKQAIASLLRNDTTLQEVCLGRLALGDHGAKLVSRLRWHRIGL